MANALDENTLGIPMTVEAKNRFVTFLVSTGYLARATKSDKVIGENCRQAYDTNALLKAGIGNRMRSLPPTGDTTAAPRFQPVSGTDQTPKRLARASGAQTNSLRTELTSVRQDEDGVDAAVLDPKRGKTPASATDIVAIRPLMTRRFWREADQIFGGHLHSNLPLNGRSYPATDSLSKKGVAPGVHVNGPAAVCPYFAPDWQAGAVAAGCPSVKTLHERAMQA